MPGNAGKRWCSRWVSAERAASRRNAPIALRTQLRDAGFGRAPGRVRKATTSPAQRTDPLREVVEIQVDVADPVLAVDQVRVHQRVPQDHQRVVLAVAWLGQAQGTEHPRRLRAVER